MTIALPVPQFKATSLESRISLEKMLVIVAIILAVSATIFAHSQNWIVAYGDSESHLNISKRVIHSLTPGFAQLGGIWLPLPHLMMLPFIWSDYLWRTGLAGAIVGGFSYVISVLYIYKLTVLLTKLRIAAVMAASVFALNPNVLYMQATPMTELPLIAFFTLSTYYFVKFLQNDTDIRPLIFAAFFGFCATLSRYDGWFLVMVEAGLIGLLYLPNRKKWAELRGKIVLFAIMAFFGMGLWVMWDALILGDPFYFTTSEYSARSQQLDWLARGELPAYHNPVLAFLYYTVTSMANTGVMVFILSIIGLVLFLQNTRDKLRYLLALLLLVPFWFYVVTLFVGQSVIFIPHITPVTFEWRLFNARYGMMMVPVCAVFVGFLFGKVRTPGRALILALLALQLLLYPTAYAQVISLADATEGLSQSKFIEAQKWLSDEYDGGLVLVDDYSRTLSIIRTKIPMQSIIYVGNKPYWEESLETPEKHAKWIIMQENDAVWSALLNDPVKQGNLYKYYKKVYTAPDVLIFERNTDVAIN